MVIYFSGIGGVGIGPLAEIAHDAGYTVIGSDAVQSLMTDQLVSRGISVHIGQDDSFIAETHSSSPIDWFVYSASISPNHPEYRYALEHGIRMSKRDELLSLLIKDKGLKLVAVAGTHGKTTVTSMLVWAFHTLNVSLSYSVGSTLQFGPSGKYESASNYFVYECDEYDRNFLHFSPELSLITSLDYDHPDTYKNEHEYKDAFLQFIKQSSYSLLWEKDLRYVGAPDIPASYEAYDELMDLSRFSLPGNHVRHNAFLVYRALHRLLPAIPEEDIIDALNQFPGSDRRFEMLAENLYSDYGHHPAEIAATLQLASELDKPIVLVYQPHQNIRQYELKSQYTPEVFNDADEIYWLPTYLSREDPNLSVLTPEELSAQVAPVKQVHIADMNDALWQAIQAARNNGKLVLVMGAGSIDHWAREQLQYVQTNRVDKE